MLLFAIGLALWTGSSLASAKVPPAATSVAQANETRPAETRLAEAERARLEAEHRQWVLEARQDIQDSSYSRLEILIGILGAILAVLVVVFGLNFGRQAAAAARDEVRKELKDLQEELVRTRGRADDARTDTEQARVDATSARGEIDTVRREAGALLDRIRQHERDAEKSKQTIVDLARSVFTAESATSGEAEELADAAAKIESESPDGRSGTDYQVLIGAAAASENWHDVRKLTAEAKTRFAGDEPVVAFALLADSYALGQLGRTAEALATYDQLIERFGGHEDSEVRDHAAVAFVNKGALLANLGKSEEAIAVNDEMLSRYDDSEWQQHLVAVALVNKAIELERQSRSAEAKVLYETVMKRFGRKKGADYQRQVAKALYNQACYAGREGDATRVVSLLRRWAKRDGQFDCGRVTADEDFNSVRDDPSFAALLEEMGCKADVSK